MADLEFTPNSHKYKEEQKALAEKKKQITKVTTGTVKTKKNEVRKFTDVFISEDIANVKDYIFMDVLVPAIKKAISDIVRNGIDMILYGEAGRSKDRRNGDYVSYRSYSDRDRRDEDRGVRRTRTGFSYDDIVLETRGEAEEVLSQMDDCIREYGLVSVGDLYDLVGISDPNYMKNKYGWTNLHNAEVIRIRDGYLLKLPKAIPL